MYRLKKIYLYNCLSRRRVIFLFSLFVSLLIVYSLNFVLLDYTGRVLLKQQRLDNSAQIRSLNAGNFKLGISRNDLLRLMDLVTGRSANSSGEAESILKGLFEMEPAYEKFYAKPIPVSWFSYDYFFYTNELLERAYTLDEHRILMNLFEMVTILFGQNKIEFMLKDGSLIGTYRHFDVVPWDDDADILVSQDDYERLKEILKTQKMFPNLNWTKNSFANKQFEYLKVFHKDGTRAGEQRWTSPYIDIFYYHENETHIWEEFHYKYHGLKANIFPLKLRPFGKWWLPCPKRPMKYFKSTGMSNIFEDCVGSLWNHREERRQIKYASRCAELRSTYPFVEHSCFRHPASSDALHKQLALTSRPPLASGNEYRFYYMSPKNDDWYDSDQSQDQQMCIESLVIDGVVLKQIIFVY